MAPRNSRRVELTNVTDLRRQWAIAGFLDINRQTNTDDVSTAEDRNIKTKLFFVLKLIYTAAAASIRRSCQLRVLSGVPDLETGQSRVLFGGVISL